MNDFDVPPHSRLGTDLSLPHLLTLQTLQVLEIRDTWLGCDSKLDLNLERSRLQKLVLTGNMYIDDPALDSDAYTTWIRTCGPSLQSLDLGTPLALPEQDALPSPSSVTSPRDLTWEVATVDNLPRIHHLHIDASLVTADTFYSTMEVLGTCQINNVTISYGGSGASKQEDELDEFEHQCALDNLEEWKEAVEEFLRSAASVEWNALRHISIAFGKDVKAKWEL